MGDLRQGSRVLVKIDELWLPSEVLWPCEIADPLGKRLGVAVLKLVGEHVAPAGLPQGSATGTFEGFIAGFSNVRKGRPAKLHIAEGAMRQLSMHEFAVTACPHKSWIGGPVLDTRGRVIGVITGEKDGGAAATMSEHLTYYSALLGLETPAWGG
ncbi:g3280 [Coccomyxa elongata]